jgi:hypothetical protein
MLIGTEIRFDWLGWSMRRLFGHLLCIDAELVIW